MVYALFMQIRDSLCHEEKFMLNKRVGIDKFLNFEYNFKLTTISIYFIPIIVGI